MKHQPFERLHTMLDQQLLPSMIEKGQQKERISKKKIDLFCRELLEENPLLRETITKQMSFLREHKLPLPAVHITSKSLLQKDGTQQSTGFVENIKKNGFRKRDTNVGIFIRRGQKPVPANPEFFEVNPQEFIKSVRLFLERYTRHGLRTNKQVLGDFREKGKGIPAMVLIQGNLALEHGTDYDDHFILKEGTSPDEIIGSIDLEKHNEPTSKEDLTHLVQEILNQVDFYYRSGLQEKNELAA
ncbi:hypothetical protein HYV70_02855 [Candidatus Uhrbacteria bacterium]|nr:hypothetical protein [Candidatus Uhrbacteria bacterium]